MAIYNVPNSEWTPYHGEREEANKKYAELLSLAEEEGSAIEVMRELARKDLFFLISRVLCIPQAVINKDWVFQQCRMFEKDPYGYLDIWPREHFKAVSYDEKVMTSIGWKKHGELDVGDYVFAPSGKKVMVLAKTRVFNGNRLLRLTFQDGCSIVCSEEHEWKVIDKSRNKRDDNGYRSIKRTERISEARFLKVGENISTMEGPIEFDVKQLPIDPYVLGVWLGDGDSASPYFTKHKDDIQIINIIRERGYKVRELFNGGKVTSKWAIDGTRHLFKSLNLLCNKHIPNDYMLGSIDQRFDLLRGLMDTDGHCNRRGTATFSTIRKELAEQVYDLATSLSLRPSIQVINAKVNGEKYISYRVAMQNHSDRNVFYLNRKASNAIKPSHHRYCRNIVKIEEVESVPNSCIQVEGGMYLVGRDMIPTHNSTIITLAFAIQMVLNDPNITICIFSYNRPIAKAFLRVIKAQFETNELLKTLFPDILYAEPHREAPKWSEDDGIIVKRTEILKEATVEAWGLVDGQPTSRHYKCIIYDDVVVPSSVTSPEMINKTSDMMSLSFNLESESGTLRIALGTRYHYNDTYKVMIDRGAFKLRLFAATHNGRQDGVPWLLSRERLDQKISDMGPYVSSCQLFGNPVMEGMEVFSQNWIGNRWKVDEKLWRRMNRYILVDPANEKRKESDYSVFWVIGAASDNKYYVIDMIRDKLNLDERTKKLFELHRKYAPLNVAYEKYGMQSDIQHMEYVMNLENYRFQITEVGGIMGKNDRIKRLIPVFSNNRLVLADYIWYETYEHKTVDMMDSFIKDEYLQFPFMVHDDMLDCLARILEEDVQVRFPKIQVVEDLSIPSWLARARNIDKKPRERRGYDIDTYAY